MADNGVVKKLTESVHALTGFLGVKKGETLADILAIAVDANTSVSRPREQVIKDMAAATGSQSGVTPSTVSQIMRAEIQCPPRDRLRAFASVLEGVSEAQLVAAAMRDGCSEVAMSAEDEIPMDGVEIVAEEGAVRIKLEDGRRVGSFETPEDAMTAARTLTKQEAAIPPTGAAAKWLFVAATPQHLDRVRKSHLCGSTGRYFEKFVLEPVGLERHQVSVTTIAPEPRTEGMSYEDTAHFHLDKFVEQLEDLDPIRVITLGAAAAEVLKECADMHLPYPSEKSITSEFLSRVKSDFLTVLKSDFITTPERVEALGVKSVELRGELIKSEDEKQIAYYVVYPRDEVDLHGEFASAEAVEEAAHRYLTSYRFIGKHHEDFAGGVLVESWTAKTDFEMGGQQVKEGDWLAGIKWSDEDWEEVKSGVTPGISLGGLARRRV